MAGNKNKAINPFADLFLPDHFHVVNFNLLAWKMWCSGCEQPLSLRNLVRDRRDIFELHLRCLWCKNVIIVPLLETEKLDLKNESSEVFESDKSPGLFQHSDAPVDFENHDEENVPIEDETLTRDQHFKSASKPFSNNLSNKGNIQIVSVESLYESLEPRWLKKIRKRHGRRGTMKTYSKHKNLDADPDDQMEDDDSEPETKLSSEPVEPMSDSEFPEEEDNEVYEIPEWVCKPLPVLNKHCGYCGLAFKNVFERRKHYNESHPDYQNNICWCGKKCSDYKHFVQHQGYYHTLKALCEYCGKELTAQGLIIQHIKENHDIGEPVQCKICSKKFKTDLNLKHHMKIHSDKLFECFHCAKRFQSKHKLVEHIALHTKVFDFKCHICPAKFTRADNLRNHVKNNHNYVCSVCAKHFLSAQSAKEHVVETHTEEEIASTGIQFGFERITKFVCTICGRCLATKQAQQLHEKTHLKTVEETNLKNESEIDIK